MGWVGDIKAIAFNQFQVEWGEDLGAGGGGNGRAPGALEPSGAGVGPVAGAVPGAAAALRWGRLRELEAAMAA